MIQIAVLGYGTVSSGVVEVINTNHDSINKRAENEINIKYVLDLSSSMSPCSIAQNISSACG